MYLHRATPRALLAAQIVLWSVLTQVPTASADVSVNVELADQLPPLAHVKQHYDWQFLANTFTSSTGDKLSYSIQGLPEWATFNGEQRRITGDPTKSKRGDESHVVQVTAKDGTNEATSSFRLTTITAPAPSLNVSLKDQLPQAASMGMGNMLPNKVLHMPLGWSFSVGFDGDTFVLPEDDRVYYSTYLEGAKPLPDWLVFNEEEMTYSGIAPTDAGPNGTMFNIVLIASNRANTGGPTSSFQMFLGGGIITLNDTAAALPVANVTEGDTLQYHIPQELFLLDGFARKRKQFSFALGEGAPSWLSYDPSSQNLTGTAPFDANNKDVQNTTFPLLVTAMPDWQISVNLTAANPVAEASTSSFTKSLKLIVKNSTKTNTTESVSSGGLSGSEKGAIAGSILGAAVLALLATLLFCCLKRRRTANQEDTMPDMENQDHVVTEPENPPLESVESTNPEGNYSAFTAGAAGAGLAGVGAASDKVPVSSAGAKGQETTTAHKGPTTSANYFSASSANDQPYEHEHREVPVSNDEPTDQNGVTQILPVDEPEWRRDNNQVVLTPFLSQSTWQPPMWTQMTSPMSEGPGHARSGAASPLGSSTTASPFSEDAQFTMAHEHVDDSPVPDSMPRTAHSKSIMALIKAPISSQTKEPDALQAEEPQGPNDQGASTLGHQSSEYRTAPSVPPATVTEAEPEERITEVPEKDDVPAESSSDKPPAKSLEDAPSNLPKPASFLAGFKDRSRATFQPTEETKKVGPRSNLFKEGLDRPEVKDTERDTALGLPPSISKSSKASWEDNLWYEPVSTPEGSTRPSQALSKDPPKMKQRVPTDRATFLSAFASSRKSMSRPNSQESVTREETPFDDNLWPAQAIDQQNRSRGVASRVNMPSIISKTNEKVSDESKPWSTNDVFPSNAPQLSPITTSRASPLVPGIGDPPTISTRVEPGLMTPMSEFVAPATQPMDVKRTHKVASYTPKLETVPALQKPGSIHVEPKNYGDMFEDAEEPVVDPFAAEEYPYGTVLYQQQHSRDAVTGEEKEADVETWEDFRSTEGGLATVMHFPEERDGQAPAALPRSGTMASIQMAETRSVTFSALKPPRLQLASCHPGQAISLPLMTSDASLPRHLAKAIEQASTPARYVPQIFAPSRPDLHQQWPRWLDWLAWDAENHELTGMVPPHFAEFHRLPMQLPIHILLENGAQILKESSEGVSSDDTMVHPLLARILLTILPAAPSAESNA
ncbi:polarity establishment/cellular polarization [Malassezia equina]|uniref:Polarity establishment/cellular polarization n=1 Tax=Malassezia equina TaxID=1381935 RepID=A0AAF0IYD4_9BASI|nr:polarity establishment/cellular polarization [Malassezia equina]